MATASQHAASGFALVDDSYRSGAAMRPAAYDRREWILLGCVAALYLPLIFTGPGADPDSLRELRSGAILLRRHRYLMSRPPGYFPYELLCGVLYALGGSCASNLATLAMSLGLLDSFLRVCEHFEVPHHYILAATMAVHPVYWGASTSTIDFIWALGCFFIGFRLLLSRRCVGAAIMLGLAVGIRLSSVLLVGPLFALEALVHPRDAQIRRTGVLATAIGAALYLPEFVAAGYSFGFLTCYRGAWTLTDYLGRFIYKNVYFWGLPATIMLLAVLPTMPRAFARCDRRFVPIITLAIAIVVGIEALFLALPVQRAYLLPMLPFVLILFGLALRGRRRLLLAMTLLVLTYNFVNLNLARPDVANHATRASFGFFVEPGYLATDISQRLALEQVPL